MDAELRRKVDALRRPLELAAKDGFAGVRQVKGLGNVLRVASASLAGIAIDGFEAWRTGIESWETLDEMTQQVAVARGMRLLARIPRPAGATIERAIAARAAATAVPLAPKPAIGAAVQRDAISRGAIQRPPPDAISGAHAEAPAPGRGGETGAPAPKAKRAAKRVPAAAKPEARSEVEVVEVVEVEDPMALPTHSLPGIGPAFAEKLAEKGLETVEDLLWTLPRRYDDVRTARPLSQVIHAEGERVTFVGTVTSSRMIFARGRRWAEVRVTDLIATTVVRWFNVWAGIEKRMPVGCRVVLSGVVSPKGFANPDVLGIEIEDGPAKPMPTILARYPDVPGVPASRLRVACATACARIGDAADDGVPKPVEAAAGLPSLASTLAQLHSPASDTAPGVLEQMNGGTSPWQRRLAFGELFALGIAVAQRRRIRRADLAVPCVRAGDVQGRLERALPFAMTRAQRRTVGEIADDLGRPVPMNRLLQGDVGSGKTAVAFAAALQVVSAGRQVAVMAPTELLSEQHFGTWKRWAARLETSPAARAARGDRERPLRIELLTASTPRGIRASMVALLAAGQVDILIGTHALIAESVGFGALGLVIIDEQHRFGVAQRMKLRDKGDGQGAPHLLVMTATPIPRTLALTAFGDLDVSLLDELPPGRLPIATQILTGARGRTAAYKLIGQRVAAGERAYIVCPKVESSEPDDEGGRVFKDATTTAAEVAAALPTVRVGLVHGRLDGLLRDRVMRAFACGELDVLVATTVIEVGVDVPAATVMVIHDAERFGLAQLHQLRGRVGRGGGAAHCLLLSQGALGEEAGGRLGVLAETTDGFRIAEEDLMLRGPGELLGPKQAGVPRLRFGDLAAHTELLLEARRHAERVLDEDPALERPEHASLRQAIARRLARHVYGAEAG